MMVPQGGKSFSPYVYIRAAAEPLSKRLKDSGSCPCDVTFVPTDLSHEWEEKHLRGNIGSLITSEGPWLGALIKWLQILIMIGTLKHMCYPEGWDHAESTDFCLNLVQTHLCFKRGGSCICKGVSNIFMWTHFHPSCLIRDNLLEFPFSTP